MDDQRASTEIQLSSLQRAIIRVLHHNQARFSSMSTQSILYDLKRKHDRFWDSGAHRNVSEFAVAMEGLCGANLVEHQQQHRSNAYALTAEGKKLAKHLHEEKYLERQESPPGQLITQAEARYLVSMEKDKQWELENKAGVEARMLKERQRKIDGKAVKCSREL